MKTARTVKIIQTHYVTGVGLLAEIQHHLNGIAPMSILQCMDSGFTWQVEKRVLHGDLIVHNQEVIFDKETAYTHIHRHFTSPEQLKRRMSTSLRKRKQGIYAYLLRSDRTQTIPDEGMELCIQEAC